MEVVHNNDVWNLFPDALAHPIHCAGLSHDTLSNQIKKSFPTYFREYARNAMRKKILWQQPLPFDLEVLFGIRWIIQLPLRKTWQENLKPEEVRNQIEKMIVLCEEKNIHTLAFPILDGPPEGWLEKVLSQRNTNHLKKIILFHPEKS